MSQSITVRPVSGKSDLRAFLDVPFAIYRDDPNWIPPLYLERFEHLDPKKNPYFQHADVQLFLAERAGQPVGRISAQFDRLRNDCHKDDVGQFGFIEAPDDPQVFAALFDAAQTWLAGHNARTIQGPFNFSINDEMGCLIEGFDTPPNMMMAHARPYYGPRIEEQGFVKAKDVIAYDYDGRLPMPPKMRGMIDRVLTSRDISIRPLDKRQLDRELGIIFEIFNDAWTENWGFVPFTAEELKVLGNNLKFLIKGDYVAIASYRGEPAAMAVTLPNLNDWIRDLNGRLLPFGWAKLMWRMFARPPLSGRLPLLGVKKKFHGSLTGTALALGVIETVYRYHTPRGTYKGELSWILEDNLP
ncbi:MAG: N-acetyltransferase, partial [Chrysiogenetes bacterium]|nr:N-acetyltransferase [Chrysiogenetes bacterium]